MALPAYAEAALLTMALQALERQKPMDDARVVRCCWLWVRRKPKPAISSGQ